MSLHYNDDISYLFVNVIFSTPFCLGSISDEFSANESRKVSFNRNVYDFSVDYNSIENVSSKENEKPCFFVTFNIIISHIFPENFIEILEVVQKIRKIYLSILAIFINFHQFLGFFDISLLQRN